MKNKKAVGNAAEEAAAGWIEKNKGYKITDRNYSGREGEIDIIASRGKTLCFRGCYRKKAGKNNKDRHEVHIRDGERQYTF